MKKCWKLLQVCTLHDKGLMIDKLKERMFLEGNKQAEASERNRHWIEAKKHENCTLFMMMMMMKKKKKKKKKNAS
jgi:hypothetical protein